MDASAGVVTLDCGVYVQRSRVEICVERKGKLEPFRQKYEIKIFILAKEVLASLFQSETVDVGCISLALAAAGSSTGWLWVEMGSFK